MDKFGKAGLFRPQDSLPLKLHVTLMNSTFRRSNNAREGSSTPIPVSFDCRGLLDKYSGWDFGKVIVRELHLSKRFSTDARTGYYNFAKKINLDVAE